MPSFSASTGNSRSRRSVSKKRGWFARIFRWLVFAGLVAGLLLAIGVGYLYFTIAPTLPDVQQLREVQLQMPLRIFTADGDLIAEYGEKRREPVMISEVPDSLSAMSHLAPKV